MRNTKNKYSDNFNRDYNWYLSHKDIFDFDGTIAYKTRDNVNLIQPFITGKSAKECFYTFDTTGKVLPCKEHELLYQIVKCKGSINFHIKMWSEDRAGKYGYTLSKIDFEKIIQEYALLDWMITAVETQKAKYFK